MSLASIEAALVAGFKTMRTDLVAFAMKVQSGAEILFAEAETALSALVANAGGLASDLQTIDDWVAEFLPLAQAAGLSAADAAKVNTALADAKNVVAGLTAVQAAAAAGAGNVPALVSGIAAYQTAQASVNNLVAVAANVPAPNATQ